MFSVVKRVFPIELSSRIKTVFSYYDLCNFYNDNKEPIKICMNIPIHMKLHGSTLCSNETVPNHNESLEFYTGKCKKMLVQKRYLCSKSYEIHLLF